MKIKISSEVGLLRGVIVHTPGHEVSLVNPELKDELLFDDIIFEEDARGEHLDMLEIFKTAMLVDGQVLEIVDLLLDCFKKYDARAFFITQMIKEFPEYNLNVIEKDLLNLSPADLLKFITQGSLESLGHVNLHPSPNLLFTRDLAAVVNSSILISRTARKARLRESLMIETLVRFHSLFEPVAAKAVTFDGQQSIEGGDVLVESEKLVLIGMSERTSYSGLMKAAKSLLQNSVETVLAVDIPKQRSSMHLDTIFTFASTTECVVFPPAIIEQQNNVIALQKSGDTIVTDIQPSLKDALDTFSGHSYTFIKCGGEDRTNQFREQWTDGANLFALAPGIVVGYERNTNTFNTLIDHGYEYMNQFEFIEEFNNTKNHLDGRKIAISFQGHELCRGRGGARCMTLPVSRDPITEE